MTEEREIPIAAVLSKLKQNTSQRNELAGALDGANKKNICLKTRVILEKSRLIKYEGPAIIDEIFEFAVDNSMFVNCYSAIVGCKSEIKPYKLKSGKTVDAHHTIYGHYLGSVKDMGPEPTYYNGNFMVKTYEDIFKSRLNYGITECSSLESVFDLSYEFEDEVEIEV
jgi:hypothetical protein